MLVKTYTQYAQNHSGFSISSDRYSNWGVCPRDTQRVLRQWIRN